MHSRKVGLLSRQTLMRLSLLRIDGQSEVVSVKKNVGNRLYSKLQPPSSKLPRLSFVFESQRLHSHLPEDQVSLEPTMERSLIHGLHLIHTGSFSD